jgi:hypothetical protein
LLACLDLGVVVWELLLEQEMVLHHASDLVACVLGLPLSMLFVLELQMPQLLELALCILSMLSMWAEHLQIQHTD